MAITNTKTVNTNGVTYDSGTFLSQNWTEISPAGANVFAIEDNTMSSAIKVLGSNDSIYIEGNFADYQYKQNGKSVTLDNGKQHIVITMNSMTNKVQVSTTFQFLDGVVVFSNKPGNTRVGMNGLDDNNNAKVQILTTKSSPVKISAADSNVAALYFGGSPTNDVYTLTTGIDIATAQTFNGTLSANFYDGVGPTLNSYDQLTGSALTNNTLNIVDAYGSASDIMPAGLTLNNIQNINLNTAGNAGQVSLAGAGVTLLSDQSIGTYANGFNTSSFASVTATNVISAGGSYDAVQASSSSTINVTHNNVLGGVITLGGSAVTVNTNGNGGVAVVAYELGSSQVLPTGAITVNANGYLQGAADVDIVGGTNVSVNVARLSATGDINIGNVDRGGIDAPSVTSNLNPTGTITVVDNSTAAFYNLWPTTVFDSGTPPQPISLATALNNINIAGGTNVTVTAKGDNIEIGEDEISTNDGAISDEPTGTVTVTNLQPVTYNDLTGKGNSDFQGGSVKIYGGTNISVTTNTGGGVTIGQDNGLTDTYALPSGTITVVNTASDLDAAFRVQDYGSANETNIQGGTNVSVQAAGGGVYIGVYGGNDDSAHTLSANPTGTVIVTESTASAEEIYIDGGNGITVNAQGQTVTLGHFTGVAGAVLVNQQSVYTGVSINGANGIAGVQTTGVDSTVTVNGGTTVTINTTGGDVLVGTAAATDGDGLVHVPSGAVNITNTFSGAQGANASSVHVLGGTTVNITEKNTTSGSISVGAAPALNTSGAAGTSIKNATSAPTGNVTINNSVTNGAITTYGTGPVYAYTNGSQQVSITGADDATIQDINTIALTGGTNAGQAAGTSTLSTVLLDGVQGIVQIDSNAIAALTIADTAGFTNNTTVTIGAIAGAVAIPAHILALTLANTSSSTQSTVLTDATMTALTIGTTGSAANAITLTGETKLTTLTLNNATVLTLGDISANAALTTINAAGATGSVTVTLNADKTTFVGGSGNDVVTVNTTIGINGNASLIQGGSGIDTVNITNTQALYNALLYPAAALINDFTSFENLGIQAGASGNYNVSGFLDINVGSLTNIILAPPATPADISITNATAGSTLTLSGSNDNTHTIGFAQAVGGALTVNIGSNADVTVADLNFTGAKKADSPTSLTINSISDTTDNSTINTLNVSANAASSTISLNVSGDADLVLSNNATVDVQQIFSGATVTNTANTNLFDVTWAKEAGVSVTGGAGMLTVNLDDYATGGKVTDSNRNDVLTSGSGGVFATLGDGNQWGAHTGSETVILSASAGVRDTLVALTAPTTNNGTSANVSGWVNGITGDVLSFSDTAQNLNVDPTSSGSSSMFVGNGLKVVVIANTTTVTGVSTATYSVSNGIITLLTGTPDLTTQLADAKGIVAQSATASGTTPIAAIQISNSTYVIRDVNNTSEIASDAETVIQLNGVTGVTGFASSYASNGDGTYAGLLQTGAGNSIAIATQYPAAMFANVTDSTNVGDATLNKTYVETGYAAVVFAPVATQATTVTTTYSNLANAGGLILNNTANAGAAAGNVVVSQVGTASELVVSTATDSHLTSLTYGGNLVISTGSAGADLTIDNLISTTSTQIQITDKTGGGAVTLSSITDAALTLIDASLSTSAPVSLGTSTSYLTQTGLTVKGGAGVLTVFTSGANDVITTHNGDQVDTITAAGANNTFNLGGEDTVNAGGANNIFNIVKDADADIVTIQGPATGVAQAHTGIGANAVINQLDTGSIDAITVNLQGTFTGGTSASYNFTTLTNASANDTLTFNNAGNGGEEIFIGQVNVAGATTLAQALDLAALVASASNSDGSLKVAAHTGVIDWFQFGGNTYIVETVNSSGTNAAQTGINANDVVVELTGLVDLTNAGLTGSSLHLGQLA